MIPKTLTLGRSATLAAALACAAHAASAQGMEDQAPRTEGWSLARTMRAFDNGNSLQRFLPKRGTVTVVITTHRALQPDRVEVVRLNRDETEDGVMGGDFCDAFPFGLCWGGVREEEEKPWRWRRVNGTRFVRQGAGARSPVFVEWRRENDSWVISRLGGERTYRPPLLGRVVGDAAPGPRVPLRLPLPDTAKVAAGQPWFENNEPILVIHRLVKYGLPRQLSEADLVRWGTLPSGVAVYVEPGTTGTPEVVYIPVDRNGTFQPYQNET